MIKNYLKTCGFKKIQLETVERYNSFIQLQNILCKRDSDKPIEEVLEEYIFPKDKKTEVRLPDSDDQTSITFNRLFERGVNSELMGNCLRWTSYKN